MLWWHKNLILGITCMLAWRLKIVRSGVSVFFMNLHTVVPVLDLPRGGAFHRSVSEVARPVAPPVITAVQGHLQPCLGECIRLG